ncbi:9467_t:CDS:2 [Paraglomus brasilianum]|uniref:9467_t:CDS:1 n=1 Tax=Paraglomus brasilianum TaxID=144538 RepID=A0A9N9H2T2_9GLOM|nr:9467_t:CDS:2 [Paraglomus brasilianum]
MPKSAKRPSTLRKQRRNEPYNELPPPSHLTIMENQYSTEVCITPPPRLPTPTSEPSPLPFVLSPSSPISKCAAMRDVLRQDIDNKPTICPRNEPQLKNEKDESINTFYLKDANTEFQVELKALFLQTHNNNEFLFCEVAKQLYPEVNKNTITGKRLLSKASSCFADYRHSLNNVFKQHADRITQARRKSIGSSIHREEVDQYADNEIVKKVLNKYLSALDLPFIMSDRIIWNALRNVVVDSITIYAKNKLLPTAQWSSQTQLHDRVRTELDVHTLDLQIPTHMNVCKKIDVKALLACGGKLSRSITISQD